MADKKVYAYVPGKNTFVRVLEDKGDKVKVLLPGRQRATTISKTQLGEVPDRIIAIRDAKFDQDCGCRAVAELENGVIRTFNLYGSVRKYIKAAPEHRVVLDVSPHHRRVFLKEHGFSCSKGNHPRKVGEGQSEFISKKGNKITVEHISDVGEYFYEKEAKSNKDGKAYKLVSI